MSDVKHEVENDFQAFILFKIWQKKQKSMLHAITDNDYDEKMHSNGNSIIASINSME